MKPKHTPRPWMTSEMPKDRNGNETVMISTGRCIASVAVNDEEQRANAKLIATAPEMLEEHESDLILLDVCCNLLKEKKDNSVTIISHLQCIIEAKKRVIKKATL